jgi:hypothetical protein
MNRFFFLCYASVCALLTACSSAPVSTPVIPSPRTTPALNTVAAQTDALKPQTLATLTSSELTAVDINDSGIGVPQPLWDNATQTEIITLLQAIERGYTSPTTQQIIARVLKTAAKAPLSQTPPSDAAAFLGQRLQTLASTGNVTAAEELLNTIPRKDYTPSLWRMAVSLPFLKSDIKRGCAVHQEALEKAPENAPNIAKIIFLCQLASGNRAAAELSFGLLQEQATQGKVKDSFIELAAFGLEQSTKAPTLENPTLLQITLLSLVQKDVPLLVQPTLNPTLFPRLATLPFLWSGTRIVAAEQAVSRNTLDVATLLHLYRSEKFNENEWGTIDDTQALGKVAMDDPLPTGRENALLWQKIQRTKTLEEKLSLLKILTAFNAENRSILAFAKVFYPLTVEVPLSKQFIFAAPTVVPLLLLAGDADRAGLWLTLLEIEERNGNAAATQALTTLLPYYILQRSYATDTTNPQNVARFNRWQQKNILYGRVVTAYFAALGKKLPHGDTNADPPPLSMPALLASFDNPVVAEEIATLHTGLVQSLNAGDKGKSLLLSVRLLQLVPLHYDNAVMQDVFRTLLKYGYDAEAKAIVYEMLALEWPS